MKLKNLLLVFGLILYCFASFARGEEFRRLPVKVYRDKMEAGWLGQIAGVCWGAPTEFRWRDEIIPEKEVPKWNPGMINNAFGQDDLYVEMTFLRTLEEYGLDCSIRQAGIDFANSQYALWCANREGRDNLRRGIAPPDSGHPQFSRCPNDIDYQIEADYAGLIAPGLPNAIIAIGDKFGRLMNYSDGIYGGIFVGAMYAEAFFTDDIEKIIAVGLESIPADSQYAEMVRDLVAWYHENPNDWQATWHKCQEKYRMNPEYQQSSNGGIDVKINGAYILLGLLYGKSDLAETIIISIRGGQDSDCNPSNSGGILFTTVGASKLPKEFTQELDQETIFSYTSYSFPGLLDVCEKLAREVVVAQGGKIEKDAQGEEVFLIPIQKTQPLPLELSWAPGPIADSKFTEEEMAQIKFRSYNLSNLQEGVDHFFPGWKISQCGTDMNPDFREYRGYENILLTHPLNQDTPCLLSREYTVEQNGKTLLKLEVAAHDGDFDWELVVRVNGAALLTEIIGAGENRKNWNEFTLDLTPFAGQTILIDLENKANGWMCEAGYWKTIEIVRE